MPENNDKTDELRNQKGLFWLDGNVPVSKQFDDPYYSKADGLAETRHVFIQGNDLKARWQKLEPNTVFTIAELGFGTGLNFLAAAQEWQRIAPADCRLEFISFEKYPLAPTDMEKALSAWLELKSDAATLVSLYDDHLEVGRDRFSISWSPAVHLTVHIGDAAAGLTGLNFKADAWFLDGFAPSKNPDLWSEELLKLVYDNTAARGTFATYTAAGWVRRNLIAAGFDVSRVAGHAGKREMMTGKRS